MSATSKFNFTPQTPITLSSVKVQPVIEKLQELNAKIHKETFDTLASISGLAVSENVAVLYTGSDGRQEKIGRHSPIELIIVIKDDNDDTKDLIHKISEIACKNIEQFDPIIEVKNLGEDNLLMYEEAGKKPRAFPSRALDSKFLIGSEKITDIFKKTFFDQLTDPKSKKIITQFRKQNAVPSFKKLKQAMTDDKENHCGINTSSGTLFYDGKRIKSTKFNILRTVQYSIAVTILRGIASGKISHEDFQTLPRNTPERFEWLQTRKLIDSKSHETKVIQKSYLIALMWFNKSQENYRAKKKTSTNVNPELLHKISDMTLSVFTL